MPERTHSTQHDASAGAARRRTLLRLFTIVLLVAVAVWWWAILRQGAPAPAAPPVDAQATIRRLLAARGDLDLSPAQVRRLESLQRRLARILRPLQRTGAEELRRLGEQTREGGNAGDAGLRRQSRVAGALSEAERELHRRYRREALRILDTRQRARAARMGAG